MEGIPDKIKLDKLYPYAILIAQCDAVAWLKNDGFEIVGIEYRNSKPYAILTHLSDARRPDFTMSIERLSIFFFLVPKGWEKEFSYN